MLLLVKSGCGFGGIRTRSTAKTLPIKQACAKMATLRSQAGGAMTSQENNWSLRLRSWWRRSPTTAAMLAHNGLATLAALGASLFIAGPSRALVLEFVAGACSWTVVEYLVHRWVFHALWPRLHARHHQQPTNPHYLHGPTQLVVATWVSALAVYCALLGPALGLAALAGLNLAYLVFELVHAAAHSPRCPIGLRLARQWHVRHHHANPRVAIGFVSPWLDLLLGTWPPDSVVPRPLVLALPVPIPLLHFALTALVQRAHGVLGRHRRSVAWR